MNNINPYLRSILGGVALCVMALIVMCGCTMIPKYHQPPPNISSSWPSVPGYPKTETTNATIEAADIGWRDFFVDPHLQKIIELALTNNPSLLAATYNVQQSRSLYHVQMSALVPTVSVAGSGQRTRTPNVYTPPGATNIVPAVTFTEYNANVAMASYEVDLFGRVRSLTRQALETYFATAEAQKSAQIALVAQIGAAYVTVQETGEQLDIARDMLKAAQQSYYLTTRSFEAGEASQFDLNNASTQLQNTTASVAGYAQQYAQAMNNLVLLAGGPLPPDLLPTRPFNSKLCLMDIPAGLPSDLLARRPDIMQAEHQLKAANANIGAARAAFFPTVTLTGSAGYASTTLESLFVPGSQAWSFNPQIVWPIFDLGTAYHQLKADVAAKQAQAANYQSTVQNAFREVADDLAVRQTTEEQLADNESLVKSDQQSYDLTKAGFDTGVNSALDLNVTLLSLDNARLALIQVQYSRLISLINLYQALGGGWREETVAN